MFSIECQCGNLRLAAKDKPASLTRCNCSICNRLGALWAYYREDDVSILAEQKPDTYSWGEKTITYHRCAVCGCTTHYTALDDDGSNLVALNCRMAPLAEIDKIPVRDFDGLDTWKYIGE